MKRVPVAIIAIFLSVIVLYYVAFPKMNQPKPNNNYPIQSGDEPNIELFIKKYLVTDDGTLRTNFENRSGGKLELSESIGLWLEYLAEKGDGAGFELAYEATKDHFQLKNKLIAWRIEGGNRADTNALIDDLRIIEALFVMGEKVEREDYINDAIALSKALLNYNQNADFFVDFYDTNHQYANEQLTISYVNYEAISYMEKYGVMKPQVLNKTYEFLQTLPIENGFYPQTYNNTMKTYAFNEEINLIDQLYITLHVEQAGIQTDMFYDWLSTEFYEKHHLYGRYTADTKEHTVTYESAAVYALAIMYSLERADKQFAKDLHTKLMAMQVRDETSPYNGGFIDEQTITTHSFDNLLSLLAERKLASENIIP